MKTREFFCRLAACALLACSGARAHGEDGLRSLLRKIDTVVLADFNVPRGGSDKSPELKTALAGIAFSARDLDMRFYGALKSLPLDESQDWDGFKSHVDKPLYGAAVKLEKFARFPLTIQAGTLSTSGSLSRLRSPALTAPSPLSQSLSQSYGISSALPSRSSSVKPLSCAIFAELPKSIKALSKARAHFIWTDDTQLAMSIGATVNFPRMIRAGLYATGGAFFLSDKKLSVSSPSWFGATPFFDDGWFGAFSVQASFSMPELRSVFTVDIHEQPFHETRCVYRLENLLRLGRFSMKICGFISDNPLTVCADGGTLKTLAQACAQPMFSWRLPSARLPVLSAGVSCHVSESTDDKNEFKNVSMKCSAAGKYSDRNLSAQLSVGASGITLMDESPKESDDPQFKISARFSYKKTRVKPSASVSVGFTKSSAEESASAQVSATLGKATKITCGARADFEQRESGTKTAEISLQAGAVHTTRCFRFTAKLSAAFKAL